MLPFVKFLFLLKVVNLKIALLFHPRFAPLLTLHNPKKSLGCTNQWAVRHHTTPYRAQRENNHHHILPTYYYWWLEFHQNIRTIFTLNNNNGLGNNQTTKFLPVPSLSQLSRSPTILGFTFPSQDFHLNITIPKPTYKIHTGVARALPRRNIRHCDKVFVAFSLPLSLATFINLYSLGLQNPSNFFFTFLGDQRSQGSLKKKRVFFD